MNLRQSRLFAESWNVAYRFNPSGSIFEDKETPFTIIPNSFKYWAADPFVFEHDNKIYIFAELYDYKLRRGIIGFTKFNGESFDKWFPIIIEDYHMSYPFIFEHNGEILMIPETSKAEKLILYKAVDFPYKWQQEKVIKDDVQWVDTTIYRVGEDYIGFTETIGDVKDLEIRLTKDLSIKDIKVIDCEVNKNRCGGRIFNYKNDLVKVCQDCSQKYGGALIFRICDSDSFLEKSANYLSPNDLVFNTDIYLDGMHTYTSTENIEVIDIKTRRFNIMNLLYRILSKL